MTTDGPDIPGRAPGTETQNTLADPVEKNMKDAASATTSLAVETPLDVLEQATRTREYVRTTPDAESSQGRYLNEIGAVSLLDEQEERQLAQIIEKGVKVRSKLADDATRRVSTEDRKALRDADSAKDRFIRANLRLVVSIARRYPIPPGMELLDLIQEGNLGLEHAVDKFDWRKGFRFSTYATFWIRQGIGRAIDQKATAVRIPGNVSGSMRQDLKAVGYEADDLTGESARLHKLAHPLSINQTIGENDGGELQDIIPDNKPGPEEQVMITAEKDTVDELLDVLDERARYAVTERFGLNDGRVKSFREVGEVLGVTAEGARRLIQRAISVIRNSNPQAEDFF